MKRLLALIAIGSITAIAVALATDLVLVRFRPEAEVARMLRAMDGLETVRYRSALSWTRERGEARGTTSLYLLGQARLADRSALDHATGFRMFRVGQGSDYADLSGELRALGDKRYLTYASPGPLSRGVSFSEDETWVSFGASELPSWGSLIPGLAMPGLERSAHEPWGPEGLERLRAVLSRMDVMYLTYDGLEEIIDGTETRVIDARFDGPATRSLLLDVVRARENREPTDAERLAAANQAAMLERLSFRLWIGKEDHLLRRVQAAGAVAEPGQADLVTVGAIVQVFGFNEPFEAGAPERAKPFGDVLREAFGILPLSEGAPAGLADDGPVLPDEPARLPVVEFYEAADADGDGLDDLLEGFYGTDARNPDTDGDGVSDGDEVRQGLNPRGKGSLFGFGLGT